MLTRDDLEQIRGVVREEVKSEVSQQLKPVNKRLDKFDRKLTRIQKDIKFIVHDYSNAIAGLRKKIEKN